MSAAAADEPEGSDALASDPDAGLAEIAAEATEAHEIVESSAILKLKGLPYSASEQQIREFFAGFEIKSLHFVFEPDGRPSGLGFAVFESREEALKALCKNGNFMGERYVRLLHVSASEMEEQVKMGTLAIPGNAAKMRSRNMFRQQQQQQQRQQMAYMGGQMHQLQYMPMLGQPINVGRAGGMLGNWRDAQQQPQQQQQHSGGMIGQQQHPGGMLGQQQHPGPATYNAMPQLQWQSYPPPSAMPLTAAFQNISLGRSAGGQHHQGGSASGMGGPSIMPPVRYNPHTTTVATIPASVSGLPGGGGGTYGGQSQYAPGASATAVAAATAMALSRPPAPPSIGIQNMPPTAKLTSSTAKVRGLPYRSTPADILGFFQGYQYLPDSLQVGLDSLGRPSGEAWLTFVSPEEALRAVRDLNRQYLGNRYLELCMC